MKLITLNYELIPTSQNLDLDDHHHEIPYLATVVKLLFQVNSDEKRVSRVVDTSKWAIASHSGDLTSRHHQHNRQST